jgi:AcrR family transcriptional regulator
VLVTFATDPVPDGQLGSARKRELLAAAYDYALGNGLTDMSLRPLAKAIGTSPRVLLFLFGSKEGLIRALLARAREEELRYLDALQSSQQSVPGSRYARRGPERGPEREPEPEPDLAAFGHQVWAWLAAPSHRALLILWTEGYARSLLGEPGPWVAFARNTVDDWLALLAEWQPAARRDTQEGRDERTLLLAVLRGALLDLLATGDTDRVTRAVHRHLAGMTQHRNQ